MPEPMLARLNPAATPLVTTGECRSQECKVRIRLAAVVTAAMAILLAAPTTAVAGGWGAGIDVPDPIGVGETVTAEARVSFGAAATSQEVADRGGYHAYLLRDVNEAMLAEARSGIPQEGWWRPPPEIVWLAEVELPEADRNFATATATFEVPDVPPGEYALMFCTTRCGDPMADVFPRMQLQLFPDAATAKLARDVAELRGHVTTETNRAIDAVSQLRTHALSTARRTTLTAEHLAEVERTLTVLEAAAAAEPTPQPPVDDGGPWTQHAGWFVAGLATAVAVGSRRPRREEALPDLPPVPDDAGELVTGPPVPISSVRR